MAMVRVNKTMGKIFTSAHRVLYKLSKGKIGAQQGNAKVGVLTTTGRKSGKEREVPLIVQDDGAGWLVIASFSGHDEHPAWYLNLKANPQASLLIKDETHPVVAQELDGGAYKEAWEKMASANPDYNEYQKATERKLPVLRLVRS